MMIMMMIKIKNKNDNDNDNDNDDDNMIIIMLVPKQSNLFQSGSEHFVVQLSPSSLSLFMSSFCLFELLILLQTRLV
jgi:hypothetical protein